MVITVRGRVHNGRLVVDEPTDLPEGTLVQLVEAEAGPELVAERIRSAPPADEPLSPEERRELAEIRARGEYVPHEEVRRKRAAPGRRA